MQCFYNGWKNTNLTNAIASNTYYGLKNCLQPLAEGAIEYRVQGVNGIDGDATLVGDTYYVHCWNNTGVPTTIKNIRIDGKNYQNYAATGIITANSLDDKTLKFIDVLDKNFPPYFDGVIIIKK